MLPNSIEVTFMKMSAALPALLAMVLCGPLAAAASDCDNLFGQHCLIDLPTGVHMSYFELGSRAGDALILLHTDTTGAVEWAWTAAALLSVDPNLHVYALDQRGSGATELPRTQRCWSTPNLCITQTDLAADLLAFMDAKRIPKATLVGHAMGAGTARRVALDHPERVARLILSGTGAPRQENTVAAFSSAPLDEMAPLGWQAMLEAKGVKWPQGALHMRPLDIDPDAVRNITQHWDISNVAAPQVVNTIAAQSAGQSLASWGTLDPTPAPSGPVDHLDRLAVPTLVLWGSEDAGLDRASQVRLMELLTQASRIHPGMYFYWKQYGVRPPPASGDKHDADDIGHNLSWEAPRQLAADIDSFVRNGIPTRDLYRSDAPADIHRIIAEPGKAIIRTSMP
jgi:pimeloyl-ACP methyl ester carboxylesterase